MDKKRLSYPFESNRSQSSLSWVIDDLPETPRKFNKHLFLQKIGFRYISIGYHSISPVSPGLFPKNNNFLNILNQHLREKGVNCLIAFLPRLSELKVIDHTLSEYDNDIRH